LALQCKVLSISVVAKPEETHLMTAPQINRLSARGIIVLSLLALLTVLSGYTHPPQPTEPHEGAAAHIFQLSIMAVACAALVLAFGTLYYLEHFR
jgi:hypothetical protein